MKPVNKIYYNSSNNNRIFNVTILKLVHISDTHTRTHTVYKSAIMQHYE